MSKIFITGAGIVPRIGKLLSDFSEGEIVKLNENGTPVEFYVACHDYESGLNGTGRTLLVRKDCYDKRRWNSSSVNTYATSEIDTWLNSNYKARLDNNVQTAIDSTMFYYVIGNGDFTKSTLRRSVFLLSSCELDSDEFSNLRYDGSPIPIADTIKIAQLNGSIVKYWTRTASRSTVTVSQVAWVDADGIPWNYADATKTDYASRPCFTLPSTSIFDEETLLFKGGS